MQKSELPIYFLLWTLALSVPCFAEPLIKYHTNGKVSVEGHLDADGLPHKIIRKYDEQGNLLSEQNFHHGVLEGVSKLYYPSGQLMTDWAYKHGKRHGVSLGYFRNGKLKDEGVYKDDKLDGKVKIYYKDGILKTEMNFKKDRQEGQTKTYRRDGKLEFIYTHSQGRLLNRKKFDSQGKLVLEQDYPVVQVQP
jgi:antitoxin component YwqK of YwqJK toxin-antitoxin module